MIGPIDTLLFAFAMFVAAVGAGAVLQRPFRGIFVICLTVQQGAWTVALSVGFLGFLGSFTDAIVFLSLVGVLVLVKTKPRPDHLSRGADLAPRLGALFALLMGISFLLSNRFPTGMRSFQRILGMIVLAYLIRFLADDTRKLRALVTAIMISTLISSGVAVLRATTGFNPRFATKAYSEGSARAAGTAGGAQNAGYMMLGGVGLATILFFRGGRNRALAAATILVGLGGIATTATRAATIVAVWAAAWLAWKFRRHRYLVPAVGITVIVFLLLVPLVPDILVDRFQRLETPTQDRSTMLRWSQSLIGLESISKSPLLGVGPGRSAVEFMDFEYRWYPYEKRTEAYMLHNAYIAIAVELGIPALLVFLAWTGSCLIGLRRTARVSSDLELRVLAEAIEFAFVNYLLTAAFSAAQRHTFLWILFGLALAVLRIAADSRHPAIDRPPVTRRISNDALPDPAV